MRAVAFHEHMTVRDVYRRAQLVRACDIGNAVCYVETNQQGDLIVFEHHDELDVARGSLLNGAIRMLEQEDSASEQDSADEDASTDVPESEDQNENEDIDEVSWMGLDMNFFSMQRDLLPWEREHWIDQAIEEIEEEDEDMEGAVSIYIDPDHMQLMHEAVQLQTRRHPQNEEEWLAVTFGIGVAELGRRDVGFDVRDIDTLERKILDLWHDHAINGDLQLFCVNPQPLDLAAGPTVAFIVAVDYGQNGFQVDEDRKVLIQARSADDYITRHDYYAANIHTGSTPGMMMAQLGVHDCYPIGVRDCTVSYENVRLEEDVQRVVRNGDWFQTYVHQYPPHIVQAARDIEGAEQMFRMARVFSASTPPEQHLILRLRGISPSNTPLDHRDMYVQQHEFQGLRWLHEVQSMWPFDPGQVQIVFVQLGKIYYSKQDELPILHIIVNYHQRASGLPILIRQEIAVGERHEMQGHRHQELWATVIDVQADEESVQQTCFRPPFWIAPDRITRLYKDGVSLRRSEIPWKPGDVLELQLYATSLEQILTTMRRMRQQHDAEDDDEDVMMLQLSHIKHNSFHEICDALLSDLLKEIQEENENIHECIDRQELGASLRMTVDRLLKHRWTGLNVDFGVIHPRRPFAQAAVAMTSHACAQPNAFHIYMDGSAKSGNAAWSFVVVAECWIGDRSVFQKIGYAGAKLQEDIGPFEPTALDAEATAIIAAAEYILTRALPSHLAIDIHLHFDCTAVGFGSTGKQAVPRQNEDRSIRQTAARVMISLVQAQQGLHAHHVHAHQGNPWNEAAGSVAGWIRQGGQCPIVPQLISGEILAHPLREWAWMLINPDEEMLALDQVLQKVQVVEVDTAPDRTLQFEPDATPSESWFACLKIATVNVGTMEYSSGKLDEPITYKTREIARQFEQAGYDIIAVQESRARYTERSQDGPFLKLISASNRGHGGVEVWLNLQALSSKLGWEITDKDCVVWRQDSRLICVHLCIDRRGIDVLCGYAPQSGRTEKEIKDWWQQVDDVVRNRQWQAPIWFLGDMNGRVGSVVSDSIQDNAPDIEDLGSSCMHEFCRKWDLIAPATFHCFHEGPSMTYVNPRGFESRIDFILVDKERGQGIHRSYVDENVDTMNGDVDHRVVGLDVMISVNPKKQQGFQRQPWYDRDKARLQLAGQISILPELPPIPWNVSVSARWDQMRDFLQDHLMHAFPCQKRKKRQTYLNPNTWQILCQRKDVRKRHRELQRQLNRNALKAMFEAWKSNRAYDDRAHRYHRHQLRMLNAVTYEQRVCLDAQFKKQKRHDWQCWVRSQVEHRLARANEVRGSDMFKILRPKEAIKKHAGLYRGLYQGFVITLGLGARHQKTLRLHGKTNLLRSNMPKSLVL